MPEEHPTVEPEDGQPHCPKCHKLLGYDEDRGLYWCDYYGHVKESEVVRDIVPEYYRRHLRNKRMPPSPDILCRRNQ